jgi:hypothetical protein
MTFRKLVLFLSSRDLCHCTDCLIGLPVEVTAVCIESGMLSKLYATNRTLGTNSSPEKISQKICPYKFLRLKRDLSLSMDTGVGNICVGRTHHVRLHLAPVEPRDYADLALS